MGVGSDSTLHSQHTTLGLFSPRQKDQIGPAWFNRLVDSCLALLGYVSRAHEISEVIAWIPFKF